MFSLSNLLLGQSLQELKKIEDEYKKILEIQNLQKSDDVIEAEKSASSTSLPNQLVYSRKDIESLLVNTQKLLKKLKVYEDSTEKMPYVGYEIFTQRDSLPFWQNLPLPKNYVLGPGDEIIISLWGEINESYTSILNRDGQIYIENIGIINIGGKTVENAKKFILATFSKVYSTLIGSSPRSFIDITLGELKSVNVHFVGFVEIPGVHMVHPFSNIIAGLTQAGGVSSQGTLREIGIIRNGQKIGTFDIYNYLFLGQSIGDFRLIDQDIVHVPPRKSTVSLTGRIGKPGYYEVSGKESIDDLIAIGGGVDALAAETVLLYRNNNMFENNGYLIKSNEFSNFSLVDGDSLYVPLKPTINKFVQIEGQIKNSGKYPYQKNMKLSELIDATQSFEDVDFMKTVDLTNVIINRRNPEGATPISISIDMLNKDEFLYNGDHITIPKKTVFQSIESIVITGEIKFPGIFPVNNLTSLDNVLKQAGGYTDFALEQGIEIFRDSLRIGWDNKNFILNDGDSLNVLKKTGLILVNGEVNVPGYVTFKKGDSIKQYINRAGGFSSFAEPRDVVIIHPNGMASPKKFLSNQKVLEGSTIVVNQRNLSGSSRGPTGWEAFSIISTQAGNVATTLLTLILLINQTSGASGS